jgi:ADP-dependent NAD(P)H-hydrate dehydratase / NAD(P)H-hydrate epimerase
MVKILTAAQIKELDQYTIANEPVSSIELMERASRAFVTWFTEHFNALNKVGIVCGTGNNGGDGLAIARLLKDWGYPVRVWIVKGGVPESADYKINVDRADEKKVESLELTEGYSKGLFDDRDILIDAIFGYGLSRPVEGVYEMVIQCMNTTKAIRVAVDMPSGLMADKPSSGTIVKADYTISFQLPKLSFFLPESRQFTGEWVLVDIGLSKVFLRDLRGSNFVLNTRGVKKLLRIRNKFDHKGTFGHVLLVSGSYGKMGAAILSSRGVLRAGVGLLSVYVPRCGYSIMQTSVPEAMVMTDPHDEVLSSVPAVKGQNIIGIGPGLGTSDQTVKMLRGLLEQNQLPMVIDADALNILAEHSELQHLVPAGSILTPHPKEFERLVGKWKNDFDRLEKQKRLAAELKSVVVVKGAYSTIVSPDGLVYFNSTGNPGMATGGTGDVLTGILSGLLAQGYSAVNAAIVGVFLHGLAGDLGAVEKGAESLIASDLLDFLPLAFRQVSR